MSLPNIFSLPDFVSLPIFIPLPIYISATIALYRLTMMDPKAPRFHRVHSRNVGWIMVSGSRRSPLCCRAMKVSINRSPSSPLSSSPIMQMQSKTNCVSGRHPKINVAASTYLIASSMVSPPGSTRLGEKSPKWSVRAVMTSLTLMTNKRHQV